MASTVTTAEVQQPSPFLAAAQAGAVKVVVGTATFTTLGALTGSTIGVLRNLPATDAGFRAGLNTAAFSFAFFSTREYAVQPLLDSLSLQPTTLSPHTHNFLPTFISGTAAGTVFSYFARGPKGAPRAGFTLGLGCLVMQSIVNEGDLLRIKTVHWLDERDRLRRKIPATEGEKALPPTYTRDISSPTPSVPSRETFSERSDRLIGDAWNWARGGIASLSPVKKLEVGEYQEKLKSKLREIEKEKKDVRDELGRLEKSV